MSDEGFPDETKRLGTEKYNVRVMYSDLDRESEIKCLTREEIEEFEDDDEVTAYRTDFKAIDLYETDGVNEYELSLESKGRSDEYNNYIVKLLIPRWYMKDDLTSGEKEIWSTCKESFEEALAIYKAIDRLMGVLQREGYRLVKKEFGDFEEQV